MGKSAHGISSPRMLSHTDVAGVVSVTLWFSTPEEIQSVKRSIRILKCLGLGKIILVKDVKTQIATEVFLEDGVDVVDADVFETCQKWYLGLRKAFADGYRRCLVFPGDLNFYEKQRLSQSDELLRVFASKLSPMLSVASDLALGDYSVPRQPGNAKFQLSADGAKPLLDTFFPNEARRINELEIAFPRTEFFSISRALFDSFTAGSFSKWMPFEATLQLLVHAFRFGFAVTAHQLGEIGDVDVVRKSKHEIAVQLTRMQFTLHYDYLRYHGYQDSKNPLPVDWMQRLSDSCSRIFAYLSETFVVTIDGPVASGKSTTAARLAERLGFLYIDGGVLFRVATLLGIENGVDLGDDTALLGLLDEAALACRPATDRSFKPFQVTIGARDITHQLYEQRMSAKVAQVSVHDSIRERRTSWVRSLAAQHNLIAEGRTLGREVFPAANAKFYLTAELGERAERRRLQREQLSVKLSAAEVLESVAARDDKDRAGSTDRLERSADSIYFDNTGVSEDATLDFFVQNVIPRLEQWRQMLDRADSAPPAAGLLTG